MGRKAMPALVATGVIGKPVFDYKGGIVHSWQNSQAVLEMSLKLAIQCMGEREGSDPSVRARIARAHRLAHEGTQGAEQYLDSLQKIFDQKGL